MFCDVNLSLRVKSTSIITMRISQAFTRFFCYCLWTTEFRPMVMGFFFPFNVLFRTTKLISTFFCFLLFMQSVLEMTGFRSLGENEVVDFKSKTTDKGVEATLVTGPNQKNLEGSQMRDYTKKRFRKTR